MNLTGLSASSINLYETCPFCWKCEYVDKMMGLPSAALEIGTLTHLALQHFHQFKDPYMEIKEQLLKPPVSKEKIDEFGLIRRMVDAYIGYYNSVPKSNHLKQESIDTEKRFSYEIKNSKGKELGIPIRGFIDRVTSKGIIEYKTSATPYTQETVDESLQATIYAYAFRRLRGGKGKITFLVLNKKEKDPAKIVQQLETKRSLKDFDDMYDKCAKIKELIEGDNFEPNFNDQTGHKYWSSYRDICLACR